MIKERNYTKSKWWTIRFIFVAAIIILICVFIWEAVVTSVYGKMSYEPIEALKDTDMTNDGVTNILLIGSDSRNVEDDGRSDAMILLSISNRTRSIQMISLLRDMYVEIPGHEGNRLNAAYAFGGPELLLQTVSQNLDIEVNRYVVVNFQAFANLVDAVGGVEIEVTNEEVSWINAYLNEYNLLRNMPIDTDYLDTSLSGNIILNGPQALAYSRNRYIGTDFGRTERQRKILTAIIKKMPKAMFTNVKEISEGLFPNLTTNLTKDDCKELSLDIAKLLLFRLEQSSIPAEGTYKDANIRGMAVLEVDFETNRKCLKSKIYGRK